MMSTAMTDDNALDNGVDDEIYACLDLGKPKSFFLYAGAGSGKTRSLVKALDRLRAESGKRMWLRSQHVGVITYTNAACDEIKHRLEFDPLIEVSTIHSFAWSLIGSYHADIREWLRTNLAGEIAELEAAKAKGKAGTKTARDRERSIENKQKRLMDIETVRQFVYSPTGDNRGRDALNHSEVISMTSAFLTEKPTLQRVLVGKYPILLVDESQDTNKHLMDAFLAVQQSHEAVFCLGLFGDTMQRIYTDGKVGLAESLPANWARPAKRMNHRCPGRVIQLINRVRAEVDDQQQRGRTDKPEGFVRLFILPNDLEDKPLAEAKIADRMAEITSEPLWGKEYKTLILEHHMAARRMGFKELFEPLYAVDRFRTGLLDGTLPAIRFFANDILPLVEAMRLGDRFAAAAILRKQSPFLDKASLKSAADEQIKHLSQAKLATDELMRLWDNGAVPSFLDVLRCISGSGLFAIPDALRPIAARNEVAAAFATALSDIESEEDGDVEIQAWDQVMGAPFEQIVAYRNYVSGQSPFGTHQGVKGLEFPRVMVIIDDRDARGFLFSYEKLFGTKEKSDADRKNESQQAETTIDRTRRLFYVTCSRAVGSLVIVAYSEKPEMVKARVLAEGWFESGEVEVLA